MVQTMSENQQLLDIFIFLKSYLIHDYITTVAFLNNNYIFCIISEHETEISK